MIYRLNIRHRSALTASMVEAFLALYGHVFTLISAEDGLDPAHPSVRLACDLRPGAIFLNDPPVRLVATDGSRFEFEVEQEEADILKMIKSG